MASFRNHPAEPTTRFASEPGGSVPVGPWSLLQTACATLVLIAVAYGLTVASRWPLVHDAPLMHYVVFLMDRGWAPYRDIVEINMPGSYMQAWAVIHVLGGDAHGWFAWDALTGFAAIVASAWIAGPQRRAAGLSGGGLAYLVHLSDGAWNEGQRDWIVAVLLLLASGCVFQCLRSTRMVWMASMVSLSGFATTIKPLVVVVPFALLAVMIWLRRTDKETWMRAVLWSCLGALPPLLATVLFLSHWGVWREFFATLRGIVASYAGLHNLGLAELVPLMLPHPVSVLTIGGLALFLISRSWRRWESLLLLLGAFCGCGFFLLQRKGWTYHQYTAVAFLLLWIALEVDRAIRSSRMPLRFAAASIGVAATLWLPARCLLFERRSIYPMETLEHLESDLTRAGGSQLSGKVQCLDMALGSCINALYRLKIAPSTGFIYDFYLFPKEDTLLTHQLQTGFLTAVAKNPPTIIVVSSQDFAAGAFGYSKLDRWPALRGLLQTDYRIATSFQTDPGNPSIGYRLYLRSKTD